MKEIIVEWKHYDKAGETCTRCNDTGANIKQALIDLTENPKWQGIKVEYVETKLEARDMKDSNSIIINGTLIEDILGAKSSQNHCHSCSCLAGAKTDCRTINVSNVTYEQIPKDIIVLALEKVLK